MNPLPPVTRALLIALAVGYFLQMVARDFLLLHFALWPFGSFQVGSVGGLPVSVGFQPWQLVSYGFLHGGIGHLLVNALALYQFGSRLENTWGPKRYAAFYFICVAGAGLCQLVVTGLMVNAGTPPFPTLGASGGIFGLLLAYGMLFPRERVMLLLPPIPMSARTLVIGFGVLSLLMGVTGTAAGIAHFAHLGGMLFGWLVLRYWQGRPPFGPRPRKRPPLRRVH